MIHLFTILIRIIASVVWVIMALLAFLISILVWKMKIGDDAFMQIGRIWSLKED